MAAIVYLDVDDEITSAAARLRTIADERIALVLPLGSRLGTSRINFRLLAREAEARQKHLEVVTGDASTRALAASAGLATHVSVAAFEVGPATEVASPGDPGAASGPTAADGPPAVVPAGRDGTRSAGVAATSAGVAAAAGAVSPTPPPAIHGPVAGGRPIPEVGRRRRRLGRRGVAILAVALVALVAGGLLAFQWLPSATVTLTPAIDRIGPIQLNVTASSTVTAPDAAGLQVPATSYGFDVAVQDTFPATGAKVTETTATGDVTFTNCDISRSYDIAAGSQVSTDGGVVFLTGSNVRLKRASFGGSGIRCSSGGTAVTAAASGDAGNVAAGAIRHVPPAYQSNVLFVTNPAPTVGGSHTETKQVVQADVDAAMTTLNDRLVAAFAGEVASATGVPAGVTLFAQTRVLGPATPTPDPATLVGTQVDSFQLGLSAHGTAIGADPSPVSSLADGRIRSAVKAGYQLIESSISIQVGTPLVVGSTITFPVVATAVSLRDVDVSRIRARIHGLGLPQARTVLADYGTATISVWPDWVTTIPTNDGRLSFTITGPPGASPGPSASSTEPPGAASPAASGGAGTSGPTTPATPGPSASGP